MGNYVSAVEATRPSSSGTMGITRGPSSRRSSVASGTSSVDSSSSAERAIRSSAAATPSSPSSPSSSHCYPEQACDVDPLSRTFPKPTEEVDLDEMLARKPLKWTLGHYVKEAATREPSKPAEDKDRLVQDMEAKKKEMLAVKEEIRRLSVGK